MKKKILILGATGMLGCRLYLKGIKSDNPTFGTVRNKKALEKKFGKKTLQNIIDDINAENLNSIEKCFKEIKPDVIINCIGLVKQLPESNIPERAIYINALFPHKISLLCQKYAAKLIHFSTDCVFSGRIGQYLESDNADPVELYDRSKLLGEVTEGNALTIRTSLIGHELDSNHGLLEWFLSQNGEVKGFTKAFFTGLTTNEMANVIYDIIIPNESLSGLFHISSDRISKYDLLKLIAQIYQKKITVKPDDKLGLDRSLNSKKFFLATKYLSPKWLKMIMTMFDQFKNENFK